jgi:hypothetical protein
MRVFPTRKTPLREVTAAHRNWRGRKDPAAQWEVAVAVSGFVDKVDVSREILPMQQTPRAFGTGVRQRSSCGEATKTR